MHLIFDVYSTYSLYCSEIPNLEQVENLLAEVQLKVCVVGACHVIDEHQAIPLSLEAVTQKQKGKIQFLISSLGHLTTTLCCQVELIPHTADKRHFGEDLNKFQ